MLFKYEVHFSEVKFSALEPLEINWLWNTEVRQEEIAEWRYLRLNYFIIGILSWEGWFEENRRRECKSFKVGVFELSCRENPRTFERMACDPGGVGMIYKGEEERKYTQPTLEFLPKIWFKRVSFSTF